MGSKKKIVVRESKLFGMYAFELYCLTSNIKRNCEHLFEIAPPKADGTYLKCLNEAHGIISAVLSDCTKVKRLTEAVQKSDNESLRQFEFRSERVQEMKHLLEGVKLEEMLNPKIRNTLEHFDEYLDKANIDLTLRGDPKATCAFTNLVISDWEHVKNEVIYPIRVYIANEKTFYNMKWSINLGKIHAEATDILNHLDSHPETKDLSRVGAMVVKLK